MTRSRGQRCGDIELSGYLVNETGPVSLVLDLRLVHERFGSSFDPSINGHIHYPNDIDRSLSDAADDKIRKYRADYNNNPPNSISFMSVIASTSGRLHSEFVCLLFLQAHRETDCFFFQIQEFRFRNLTVVSSTTNTRRSPHSLNRKSATSSVRLCHYGRHTHPSHWQNSRL